MALYLLITAFTIWMIVDAIRRRAEYYWLLIIIFFAPFGGVIYFFAVKLHDFQRLPVAQALPPRPGVANLPALRQAVNESPSLMNRLALAEGLRAAKEQVDAVEEYERVLRIDHKNKEALHGVSLCLLELSRPGEAVAHLSNLMDIDSRYRDYAAAIDYAEALWLDDQRELCLDVLEELNVASTRINHRVAHANYLAIAGNTDRAREVLKVALEDFEQAPSFVQRRDQGFARDAQKLLSRLT
ncbi:MAG: hypothetical protein MUF54_21750 [Polyangiaceae bacterium]|nr:hypothetical protein [Polyangiaceae bacterium]